jgi:hypothetical protein
MAIQASQSAGAPEVSMTSRRFALNAGVVTTVGLLLFLSIGVGGQTPSGDSKKAAWTVSRLPWGDPDLQGTWWSDSLTPLERPPAFGSREFLTEKEIAELNDSERNAATAAGAAGHRAGGSRANSPIFGNEYPEIFLDQGFPRHSTGRTSLIIGPTGRIPLLPEVQQREADQQKRFGVGPFFTYLEPDTGERCITDGLPGTIWSGNTGGGLNHISQGPNYVVILTESYRDRRIIPLDGTPHSAIRSLIGEPRGRWENATLVVDTTNFTDGTDLTRYRWQSQWRRATESLHLVERFTRVSPTTINYQLRIEDPATFTQPWTIEVPITNIPKPVYEYACHEGNHGIVGMLNGTRVQEEKKKTGANR